MKLDYIPDIEKTVEEKDINIVNDYQNVNNLQANTIGSGNITSPNITSVSTGGEKLG